MMILATSKSVCEVNCQYGSDEKEEHRQHRRPESSPLHHSISVSILDSIPNLLIFTNNESNQSMTNANDEGGNNNSSNSSLNSLSKSSSSSFSASLSSVVSFSDFFNISRSSSMIMANSPTINDERDEEQNSTNNQMNNLDAQISLINNPTTTNSRLKQQQQKCGRKKKLKWRNVSKELALFKCKRAAEHALYFVNTFNMDADDEEANYNDYDNENYHINDYTPSDVVRLIEVNERLENPSVYEKGAADHENNDFGLKKLIKTNDVKSLVKRTNRHFAFDNLRKGNTIIHIKYNVYKKIVGQLLETYVSVMQRLRYTNAPNRVDARHHIQPAFLTENKKFFKSIRNLDLSITNTNNNNNNNQHQQHDSHVVTAHSVNSAHQSVFDDAEYLEFLIQLQHREITPEDYEYLTRLDERIKKKTTDEAILKKLRTETIQKVGEENDEESCGICLDSYLVGQTVKYLPCGHRFHSDCIDNWLKNQSVNCPFDNLPIDSSLSSSSSASNQSSNRQSQTRENVSTPLHTVLEDPNESFISSEGLYLFDDFSISYSDDDSYDCAIEEEVLAVMGDVLTNVENKLVLDPFLDELLNKVAAHES